MATVWREEGNPYWRARFTQENGKPTNRSTKETNKAKAQKVADFLEDQARKIRNGVATEKRLLKAVASMASNAGMDKISIYSIRDVFNQIIDGKESIQRAESTIVKYKSVVKSLIGFLGDEKVSKSINTLTQGNIESWRNSLIKSGKGASTADQSVNIIRLLLESAVKKSLVPDNVADGIELIGEGSESRERFSNEEVKKLYDTATEEWKGMILMGLWYGMRINDASNLKWENIILGNGLDSDSFITYIPQKTGRKKKVPVTVGMPKSIRSFLLKNKPDNVKSDDYIFLSLGGKKTGSGGGLSNAFRRLMGKSNIDVPKGVKKKGLGRTFNKKGFHSLRHTQISRMTEAGIPENLGMAISVHANREVHQRYVHFTREVQNSVFSRIPDFLSQDDIEIEYYI
jgi:integrase